MNGVRLMLAAIEQWITPIGRPIFMFRAAGTPQPPYVVLSVAGTLGGIAEVMSLAGAVAQSTELVVTCIGLAEHDALWLSDEIYERLTGPVPEGLPITVGTIYAPSSASLVSFEGILIHAEHRYGISYR